MGLLGFKDWLNDKQESSAYTRSRRQAALGLGPEVFMWSRSTPHPGEIELVNKRKKKKRKKRKKHMAESEDRPDYSMDKFLSSVDGLKRDLDEFEKKKHDEDDEDDEDDLDDLDDLDFDEPDLDEDDDEPENDKDELDDDDDMDEPGGFLALLSRIKDQDDKQDSAFPGPDIL